MKDKPDVNRLIKVLEELRGVKITIISGPEDYEKSMLENNGEACQMQATN